MNPWHERPFLAVDTETTGIDPFTDRIVSVASVAIYTDGTAADAWEAMVNPGVDIPDGAAQVHGITTALAAANGMPPADALTRLATTITGAVRDGWPIVIYNATFDWPLLLAEADRHDVDFPAAAPILDPYLLDRMVDRFRRGGRKLVDVAAHYDVPLNARRAHSALADATAAGLVMRAIIARYPAIPAHPLAGVILRQTQGHEQDRQRFVDYMRTQRDPAFDKPAGWPIPCEPERRAS